MSNNNLLALRRSYWSLWNYWMLVGLCLVAIFIPFVFTNAFLSFVPLTMNPASIDLILRLAGVAFLLYSFIALCYQRAYSKYSVYPDRVEASHGIFQRKVSTAYLEHIRSLDVNKSLAGMLLGYGNLYLGTAGTGGSNVTMIGLDDPAKVRDLLRKLIKGESIDPEKQSQPEPAIHTAQVQEQSPESVAPVHSDSLAKEPLNGFGAAFQDPLDEHIASDTDSGAVDPVLFNLPTAALYEELDRRMRAVDRDLSDQREPVVSDSQ